MHCVPYNSHEDTRHGLACKHTSNCFLQTLYLRRDLRRLQQFHYIILSSLGALIRRDQKCTIFICWRHDVLIIEPKVFCEKKLRVSDLLTQERYNKVSRRAARFEKTLTTADESTENTMSRKHAQDTNAQRQKVSEAHKLWELLCGRLISQLVYQNNLCRNIVGISVLLKLHTSGDTTCHPVIRSDIDTDTVMIGVKRLKRV